MSQAPEIVAEFDRFDICEAYYLLACDWGLYGIISRLKDMHFKPSPLLKYATLTENAKEIYDTHHRELVSLFDEDAGHLKGIATATSLKGYTL